VFLRGGLEILAYLVVDLAVDRALEQQRAQPARDVANQ
jgi:hypothetical protein